MPDIARDAQKERYDALFTMYLKALDRERDMVRALEAVVASAERTDGTAYTISGTAMRAVRDVLANAKCATLSIGEPIRIG